MTVLWKANLLLFGLLIAHTLDHALNQPARELPATASVAGVGGFVILAASCVAAIRRSPQAPAAAVVAGATTALGVVAIHLLPAWSEPISDPYWDFTANALSWALVVAPLLAALALVGLGLRERAAGRAPSRPAASTL